MAIPWSQSCLALGNLTALKVSFSKATDTPDCSSFCSSSILANGKTRLINQVPSKGQIEKKAKQQPWSSVSTAWIIEDHPLGSLHDLAITPIQSYDDNCKLLKANSVHPACLPICKTIDLFEWKNASVLHYTCRKCAIESYIVDQYLCISTSNTIQYIFQEFPLANRTKQSWST